MRSPFRKYGDCTNGGTDSDALAESLHCSPSQSIEPSKGRYSWFRPMTNVTHPTVCELVSAEYDIRAAPWLFPPSKVPSKRVTLGYGWFPWAGNEEEKDFI